ncbi:MAG TPA: hypothetical protein VEL80_05520 [Burkholderiales bacterium]|nr:hypothetical protein [Burkholderiales bacterium]
MIDHVGVEVTRLGYLRGYFQHGDTTADPVELPNEKVPSNWVPLQLASIKPVLVPGVSART